MDEPTPEKDDTASLWLPGPILAVFLVLPSLIELTLIASDIGLLPIPRLRPLAYQYGAFWAGLLDNWRPNYAAQPWLMFLTYSFLHANFWHLAGNMVALVVLLQLVRPWLSGWSFAFVYVVSAIGGALCFGFLGPVVNPMVGASGALFGLAGAWKWQDWKTLPSGRSFWLTVLRDCAFLAGLNLLMWLLQNGALAWQAHLGGFLAGMVAMALVNAWRASAEGRHPGPDGHGQP